MCRVDSDEIIWKPTNIAVAQGVTLGWIYQWNEIYPEGFKPWIYILASNWNLLVKGRGKTNQSLS